MLFPSAINRGDVDRLVRRIVADQLGVDVDVLGDEVSLVGMELATLAKRFARLDDRGVSFTIRRESALGSAAA
jgi:hypothetical protein